MIKLDDLEEMAETRLIFDKKSGQLFLLGKPYSKNVMRDEMWRTYVVVKNGDLNDAWAKLVSAENERTAYIDSLFHKSKS